MPHFYLHLCNGQGLVEDEEGRDYPDLEAARAEAVDGLRSIMAGEVRGGALNIAAFIEIEDEKRQHVATVHFAEAVIISKENDRTPVQALPDPTTVVTPSTTAAGNWTTKLS